MVRMRVLELQFYPLVLGLRSIEIYGEGIKPALERGKGFDGSSVLLAPVEKSDLLLRPDKHTLYQYPWDPEVAGVICDIYTFGGEEYELSPRYILKKTLREAEERGYRMLGSVEIEFFVLSREREFLDRAGYFTPHPSDRGFQLRREVAKALEEIGISVDYGHHEVAFSQHELTLRVDEALEMADKTVKARFVLKNIAEKMGLFVDLMPKPFIGINGSGQHIHLSLSDVKTGRNLFAGDGTSLSKLALNFIGGIIHHMKALSAIVAPTVNSYKRLVPHHEAPTSLSWDYINRTTAIRVPGATSKRSVRVEFRVPDNTSNPYLTFAAILASGLHGIDEGMDPGEPLNDNAWRIDEKLDSLPSTLGEALDELERDSYLKRKLGERAVSKYVELKRREWRDYLKSNEWDVNVVTDWEVEKYSGYI